MTRDLHTTFGYYSPSFLRMHVNVDKDLSNLNILDNAIAESVYLHEYIHYIQDLSTVYGLANLHAIAEYLRMANNAIIARPPGAFQSPILPVPQGPDNVDVNRRLSILLRGTGADDRITLLNHRIKTELIRAHGGPFNVDIVEIRYRDARGTINTFDFGAISIMESMAHIVQTECYAERYRPPQLPYRAAELLVDLIYQGFGNNRLNILALCDISLLTQNPGLTFYNYLIDFRNSGRTFAQPEHVYDYCFANPLTFKVPGVTSYTQNLNFFANNGRAQITGYLNDPFFNDINNWLSDSITRAEQFRGANPYFILEIARGGRIRQNGRFAEYFRAVGTPLVTNVNSEAWLHNPTNNDALNYDVIWGINQVYNVLLGRQINCKMNKFCPNGLCSRARFIFNKSRPAVDRRCHTSPWRRAEDNHRCPFGVVWYHWGLTGYYPE